MNDNNEVQQAPEPKKNWFARHKILTGVGGVVVLIAVISGVSGTDEETPVGSSETPVATDTPSPDAKTETPSPAPSPTKTEPTYTVEQENAIEAAQNYVDFGPFSKKGLIDQLSSNYGDGYPKPVAKFAVKHIDVNWEAEAVEAAENYLEFGSFSRSSLIDQLSSSYGDQFTKAQAEYAASKVGL